MGSTCYCRQKIEGAFEVLLVTGSARSVPAGLQQAYHALRHIGDVNSPTSKAPNLQTLAMCERASPRISTSTSDCPREPESFCRVSCSRMRACLAAGPRQRSENMCSLHCFVNGWKFICPIFLHINYKQTATKIRRGSSAHAYQNAVRQALCGWFRDA